MIRRYFGVLVNNGLDVPPKNFLEDPTSVLKFVEIHVADAFVQEFWIGQNLLDGNFFRWLPFLDRLSSKRVDHVPHLIT